MSKECIVCGKPCKVKYCSKLCNNRAWKKSKTFLKKKCKVCKKPCRNKFCSHKCEGVANTKIYKENCLTCGKEFTYNKIFAKKRGGMIYCSYECASRIYLFDEEFFLKDTDVELRYVIMGFVFANGYISDYERHRITINGSKEQLQDFVTITKTTYPIKEVPIRNSNEKTYRITFTSKPILDYLHDIGFSHHLSKHTFPIILDEYKKHFIKGFINSPNCCVYKKRDHNLVILLTKSYNIMQLISDITNSDTITKNLEYCVVIKDYNNFYTKNLLQNNVTNLV